MILRYFQIPAGSAAHISDLERVRMRNKRQKFVELAEARVSRVLKDIQLVGNLSNSAAYEFTEADVKKIFGAIQKETEVARSRFSPNASSGPEFKLE
jgi:hypothetical protein